MAAASPDEAYRAFVEEQVHAITEGLTRVMLGDFTVTVRTTVPDDLFGYLCAMVNIAINAARNTQNQLRSINDNLERLVGERTAALRKSEERLILVQDEERRRIARELHDETGQWLTSLTVGLRALEDSLCDEAPRARARDLRRLCEHALDDVGRLARRLHPHVLESLGLAEAVGSHVAELSRSHGIRVDLTVRGLEAGGRLPQPIELALYRVVQEALRNVVKHARAETASVVVERRPASVRVIVEDDGIGLRRADEAGASGARHGLGLIGIRERVALLRGSVEIESAPGGGTSLYVEVPLDEGG